MVQKIAFSKISSDGSIKTYVEQCFLDFNIVLLYSGTGLNLVSEVLHLCTSLKNSQDVQHLKDWIAETWVNLAMVDYPYESNFLQPLPAWPIKVTGKCSFITFNHLCVCAFSAFQHQRKSQ